MTIPVVVVDDNEIDRYMLRRRLSRADDFEILGECAAGDTFVEEYFGDAPADTHGTGQLLVMLDINMPRMNGFETVEEVERRVRRADGRDTCVVLMCSTSESPDDKAEAERHSLIKGYFVKPVSADDVSLIREIYQRRSDHGHRQSGGDATATGVGLNPA